MPSLIEALKDDDKWTRHSAAIALGEIEDPRSVEPLIALLNDPDSDVNGDAEYVLCKLTGNEFCRDQERWRRWWAENEDKYHDPSVFKEFAEMNAKKLDESVKAEIEWRRKK